MKNEDSNLRIVDDVFKEAIERQIFHLYADNTPIDGRYISFEGKNLTNFGSCSYLGLETDPRLQQGTIDAVLKYGTQISSSRTYVSSPQYQELDQLLTQIFEAHVMVAPTTTLGHMATIPTIIRPKDAIILDQQVHNSVQTAAKLCQVKGIAVEIVRHSNLEKVEEAYRKLRHQGVDRVWYMVDGVYSMYGDPAPLEEMVALMEKLPQLYCYIDDSHGMSWEGKNGRGYILGQMEKIHPKVIVACSLCKAFGCSGAAFVFPNEDWKRLVQACGGPMIFSGPIQPPMMGAMIESAKIHLSQEIYTLQDQLREKIEYFNRRVEELGLPILSIDNTPLKCIGVGLLRVAYRMFERLFKDGYYINLATFPMVSMRRCGIRICLNNHLELEDIEGLLQAINKHLPLALEEENYTLDFTKTFQKAFPNLTLTNKYTAKTIAREGIQPKVILERFHSISEIDETTWNHMFGHTSFNANGMRFIESMFCNGKNDHANNWEIIYYLVKNQDGEVILGTFFTVSTWKSDILAPDDISREVELERQKLNDPYHLSSKTLSMGCTFTEGNHLYLDQSQDWKSALKLLLNTIRLDQERYGAEQVVIRDLPAHDNDMHQFFLEEGFVNIAVPNGHVLTNIYEDVNHYLTSLTSKNRLLLRKEVLAKEPWFDVEILDKTQTLPDEEWFDHCYQLYQNVFEKSYEYNVYPFPKSIFKKAVQSDDWEMICLYLKADTEPRLPVAMSICFKAKNSYCPILIGLNYEFVESHSIYKQMLYQFVKRGIDLGVKHLFLGKTASLQKRRFGAKPVAEVAYFQVLDNFKMELLSQRKVEKIKLID